MLCTNTNVVYSLLSTNTSVVCVNCYVPDVQMMSGVCKCNVVHSTGTPDAMYCVFKTLLYCFVGFRFER